MTLPRTLQQQINHIMDPPGRNRDVEETLLQVAQDPDCGDVVRLGVSTSLGLSKGWLRVKAAFVSFRRIVSSFLPNEIKREIASAEKKSMNNSGFSKSQCSLAWSKQWENYPLAAAQLPLVSGTQLLDVIWKMCLSFVEVWEGKRLRVLSWLRWHLQLLSDWSQAVPSQLPSLRALRLSFSALTPGPP